MICEQLREAIASASSGPALDNFARLLWRGHAEGLLDDAAAQAIGVAVEARRALFRSRTAYGSEKAAGKPRRPPCSPDRAASIARRRRIAASGALPPALACRFTTGEVSVLSIVAREIQRRGRCEMFVDEIAARAGVSRSTAKNAMREASRLGFVRTAERRRRGRPSDTNVVTIIDVAWRAWLRLGQGGGVRSKTATGTKDLSCKFRVEEADGNLASVAVPIYGPKSRLAELGDTPWLSLQTS